MSTFLLLLHLFTLGFLAITIVLADHAAFSWIRGKVAVLDEAKVRKYHRNTWIGLIGMIVTGVFLFIPMREYLLTRPQFYIKMAFMVTLIANAFVIGHLQKRATTQSFKDLSFKEKLPLFISGAVSTVAWLGAATTALFLVEEF